MVDARHQGKSYGSAAVSRLIDNVRGRPDAVEMRVSYVPGDGCPRDFYRKLGFAETGEMDGDKVVMRLSL